MLEPRLISPILDNFAIGDPISDHHGVRCYPAMKNDSDDRYIVKIISIPQSQTQVDALVLAGVYPDAQSALGYFKELTDEILTEVTALDNLAQLDGFVPFEDFQVVEQEDGTGYEIYLLRPYRRTLERYFRKNPLTHLAAVNLGLDLCSALTTCRRSGYLFASLKPSNIFVTAEQEYRIGDLGFLRLDSLKYASMPDKYRSPYTPPEISDAYATLNSTLDTYAVGLILYQIYNNGELPVAEDPEAPFPAPEYADYELAEIILKACDPNPENRWEDPAQMGQALVNYMQRNGVNDTPIVPPAPPVLEDEPVEEAVADVAEEPASEETVDIAEAVAVEEAEAPAEPDSETVVDEEFENLSFLTDDNEVDEEAAAEVSYEEVSSELTEILEQADDLAEHEVPAPAVAPDPVEVTLPEPEEVAEEPTEAAEETEEDTAADDSEKVEDAPVEAAPEASEEDYDYDYEDDDYPGNPRKSKKRLIWISIIAGVLILLAAAAFFFVKLYYLIPIKEISLDGDKDTLTVYVDTHIDESILEVVCSDSHGNQFTAPVVDGKAVFTGLVPDTGYNVKVVVSGFHKVTGDSSTGYSTPAQTTIQLNAVMGAEEGSVILAFNVDGPDSEQWSIRYFAEGEEAVTTEPFPSHMFTLNGLTSDKEYTFILMPATPLYMTGTTELKFTPGKLVLAENLQIISCVDGKLTATWNAPKDTEVANWTVRCYNESGDYDQTLSVDTTSAVFDEVSATESYTIEVTAAGMSVNQRAYMEKGAITLSNVKIDDTNPNQLTISWDANQTPANGWLVSCAIDGSAAQVYPTSANSVVISPVVPGGTHAITIKDASGLQVLGGNITYTAKDAASFSAYSVSASDLTFSMCKTPSASNWNRYYLSSSDYTTSFAVGGKASFVVKRNKSGSSTSDTVVTLFAVYDANGTLVSAATHSEAWSDMWTYGYCELDIPALPDTAGKYTVYVYFNGALAGTQAFTIQ